MVLFLGLSLMLSVVLLLAATEIERRDIMARRIGANGRVILASLVFSAVASLVVTALSAAFWGWTCLVGVLCASILYHGFMGVFLVHGLQETSARVRGAQAARS